MIWNPSEGIDLGFFVVRYYSLMFVIAFGLGWYIMKKIFDRENESIEKLDSLPIEQQVLLMQSGLMLYRAGKVYLTLSGVGIPCTIVSVVAGMGAQDLLIAALIAFVRSGAPQGVEAQNLATAMKACRSPDDC